MLQTLPVILFARPCRLRVVQELRADYVLSALDENLPYEIYVSAGAGYW